MENTVPTGEIIVTLESTEHHYSYADYQVTYDSIPEQIVSAIAGSLSEASPGFDLVEEYQAGNFTVKKVDSSKNTYIFPKSTAGK